MRLRLVAARAPGPAVPEMQVHHLEEEARDGGRMTIQLLRAAHVGRRVLDVDLTRLIAEVRSLTRKPLKMQPTAEQKEKAS